MVGHRANQPSIAYRLWRDLGYAVGALLVGITADLFGLAATMRLVAGRAFAFGVIAAMWMSEPRLLGSTAK
ncbi:hypothetical protein [Pandoraea sp. XY-2]|uniref:hypothetical protein n=1 Tax=Pandoraea sp. XY-2 TaxID=2518599 RepID=UPI001F0E7318|nr:hypothetical protein [Pandoraea sp. XY-2]